MSEERPIYINMPRFMELVQASGDIRISAVVIGLLAYGGNGAFTWDSTRIAEFISGPRPGDITASDLDSMKEAIRGFFVEVRAGLWAPSPDVFSMVDGNEGGRS